MVDVGALKILGAKLIGLVIQKLLIFGQKGRKQSEFEIIFLSQTGVFPFFKYLSFCDILDIIGEKIKEGELFEKWEDSLLTGNNILSQYCYLQFCSKMISFRITVKNFMKILCWR